LDSGQYLHIARPPAGNPVGGRLS